MGARFGHDFSRVHLHTDREADGIAHTADAEAVTVGRDIYFRHGAFAPDTSRGKNVLGHELAHVVQQRGMAPGVSWSPGYGLPLGERGTPHEKEARRAGEAVVAGWTPEVELRTSMPVAQRFESYEHVALGDKTHKSIGGGSLDVNDVEEQRMAAEKSRSQGGERFDKGARSLTLTLRLRDPKTFMPTYATQTVALSYGEMLALSGDVYYSVDNLKKAPAEEVLALRDLLAEQAVDPKSKDFDLEFEKVTQWRRQGVYQPGTGKKEGTKGQYWGVQSNDKDTQASFLDLATYNVSHFAARTGTPVKEGGMEGNAAADNHQAWFTDHQRAINLANSARAIKKQRGLIPAGPAPAAGGGKDDAKAAEAHAGPATAPTPVPGPASAAAQDHKALENDAYLYNAGGDHYLTDAFSAGHLFNKNAVAPIIDKVMSDAMIEQLVNDLTPYAGKEHPLIPNLLIKPKVRDGLAVFKTDPFMRHNAGAKLIHDWLNAHGAKVQSRNGRFSWVTKGDAHMDSVTRDFASRAVLASRNYIRALLNDSDADLATPLNADDAWEYTPNVDATAFSAMAEPWLRAELKNTSHLWELMKSVLSAKELLEKQQGQEESVSKEAKGTSGGDWGKQPSNARFTRHMVVGNAE